MVSCTVGTPTNRGFSRVALGKNTKQNIVSGKGCSGGSRGVWEQTAALTWSSRAEGVLGRDARSL